jgi:hypothetical protein
MEQLLSGLGEIVWFIITAYVLGAVTIVGVYVVKEWIKPKKEYKNQSGEMLEPRGRTFDDAPKVLVFIALAVGIVMRFLVLMFTGM